MLRPTKSFGEEIILSSSTVYLGALAPAYSRKCVGVFALQDHVQKARIQLARRDLGCGNVGGRIDRRQARRDILRRADFGPCAPSRTDRLHREAMGQRDIMTYLVQFGLRQFEAWGVDAGAITEIHESSAFVDCEDRFDAIAQAIRDVACVIAERPRRFTGLPSADPVLERLRQIPMIERRERFDIVIEKFVDQAVVEVETFGVRRTGSFRKYPRPGDRETIGLDPQFPDQADVFLVSMVVIVGAVRVAVILDLAGRVGERIPDRAAPAVLIDRALDLIRGSCGAPKKPFREIRRGVPVGCRFALVVRRIRRRRRHCQRRQPRKPAKVPTREPTEHRLLPSGSLQPAYFIPNGHND